MEKLWAGYLKVQFFWAGINDDFCARETCLKHPIPAADERAERQGQRCDIFGLRFFAKGGAGCNSDSYRGCATVTDVTVSYFLRRHWVHLNLSTNRF